MSHRLSSHYYKHRAERLVRSWMGANALMVRCSVRQRGEEEGFFGCDLCGSYPPRPSVTKCSYRDGKCSYKVKILLCRTATHSAEQHVLTPLTWIVETFFQSIWSRISQLVDCDPKICCFDWVTALCTFSSFFRKRGFHHWSRNWHAAPP